MVQMLGSAQQHQGLEAADWDAAGRAGGRCSHVLLDADLAIEKVKAGKNYTVPDCLQHQERVKIRCTFEWSRKG